MKAPRKKRRQPASRNLADTSYLDGQLLIAMPTMRDPRFARSVIYMCAHTKDGAMGIIINQRADHITFPQLLEQLELLPEGDPDQLPDDLLGKPVHVGGPVDTVRGFVLHSADYFAEDSTLPIDDRVCLTATIDILRAIAVGDGPERAMLALGYAGWSAGQLESEIQANGWLNCPADPDLVFDGDLDSKYERAISKIGIDLSHLVSEAGHA
jgi:putative transcriptional regulator